MNIGSIGAAMTQAPHTTHHAQPPQSATKPSSGASDGDGGGATQQAGSGSGQGHVLNRTA